MLHRSETRKIVALRIYLLITFVACILRVYNIYDECICDIQPYNTYKL